MTKLRTARKRGKIPRNITHEHYIRCDNTGLRVLSGDSRKQWDNQIVWKGQFDERHPQEFVRGVVDNFAVMDARPESPDSVTLATASATDETETGASIVLAQADAGSLKYLSFLRFTVTSVTAFAPFLRAESSADAVTWTRIDDQLNQLVLAGARSGVETQIGVGRNARYARLVLDFGASQTVTYTVALAMLGGNAI